MRKTSVKKTVTPEIERGGWYRGKQTKTGNSLGIRFDKALFRSHPEFSGEVQARVIAPGRMLVVAQSASRAAREEDPVIASFLTFLAKDMARNPGRITPLDRRLIARIKRVTRGITTSADEGLGDEALI